MNEELLKIANSHVRNLAWLLFSPIMRVDKPYERADVLFPQELLNEWFIHHKEWLLEQDQTPETIISFLAQQKRNGRLGFYAEDLLHYFFLSSPCIELLLVNEQIVEEGVTQTEIDFLIGYNDQIIHLEVAVKFYLLYDNSEWIGPDARDSLRKKWDKVLQRQLPKAQEYFVRSYPNTEVRSYFFIKGYLFYPNESNFQWRYADCFEECSQFGYRFSVLHKPNWMMDFHQFKGKTVKWETLIMSSECQQIKKATPVVTLSKYNQTVIFIVSNNWPQLDNHS